MNETVVQHQFIERKQLVSLNSLVSSLTSMSCKIGLVKSSRPKVFCKKVFLEISQNSQENTGTRDSFLIKLQGTPFFTEHLRRLLLPCKMSDKQSP